MEIAKVNGERLDHEAVGPGAPVQVIGPVLGREAKTVRAIGTRPTARRTVLAALIAALALTPTSSAGALDTPGNSDATITGSFSDSCRDFTAVSSKDISHVEFTYRDGRVVKNEDVENGHFTSDGDAGDEVDFVTVKSGTTQKPFTCDTGPAAVCSDGIDNDGNGLTDYPDDPYCAGPDDNDEGPD